MFYKLFCVFSFIGRTSVRVPCLSIAGATPAATVCAVPMIKVVQLDEVGLYSLDNSTESYCLAPQYRSSEIYRVDGVPIRPNSLAYRSFYIMVTCPEGYELVGRSVARCVNGEYTEPHGRCYVTSEDKSNNTAPGTGSSAYCVAPDHPIHGSYVLGGKANPDILGAYYEFSIEVKCNKGYELQGVSYVWCSDGNWNNKLPTCVPKYGYLVDPLDSGISKSQTHCKPPEAPKHGTYVIEGDQHPDIQNAYSKFYLSVTCNKGYQIYGQELVRCEGGKWSGEMPICGLPCHLNKDPKVEYLCEYKGTLRTCGDYVMPGDIVTPSCNDNITRDDVAVMRCGVKGYFDHIVTCDTEDMATECGLVTVSDGLVIGGARTEHGEIPWMAGIYTKVTEPYMQICGGTVVTRTAVISAAHCFWSEQSSTKAPSNYAVAVGKIYRPWNDPHDIHAQKSDILEIKIPRLYFGSSANYQNDIAVLKLATAIEFNRFVRPVCLDFTEDADRNLPSDAMMKVAGWGLISEDGDPSQVLKAVFLPIVDLDKCANESPLAFQPYITPDKICAGYKNGTSVCKGDSGGGLTFHRTEDGLYRHYLYGIVSTAPNYGLKFCNAFTWATFTSITKHKGFVYSHIKKV